MKKQIARNSVFKDVRSLQTTPIDTEKLKAETAYFKQYRDEVQQNLAEIKSKLALRGQQKQAALCGLKQAGQQYITVLEKSAAIIQRCWKRYKMRGVFSDVLQQAKRTTKQVMLDVVRQMENDTTYELKLKQTDEELFAMKRKNHQEKLEQEILRQLVQKRRAGAILSLEKALSQTVRDQWLSKTFSLYTQVRNPMYERPPSEHTEFSSFTEYSEDKEPTPEPSLPSETQIKS